MAALQTPEDIISLLQDMERRSQQKVAGLDQEGSAGESWTAIGFRIDQQHFVTPLDETREVFPVPEQITPVPKSQDWVFGIVNLRGELLPVFDLNLFLSGDPVKLSKRSRIMVINDTEIVSGVVVDEVFGLKHFQQPPKPMETEPSSALTPYVTGSVTQQDTEWHVFSFRHLTADSRFLNPAA